MKYLITGGAGFIGSNLAKRLLGLGHEIFILDNLSTGSISNIDMLLSNSKLHFIEGSILSLGVVEDLVVKVDTIFHMAAAVGVKLILNDPIGAIKTNVDGTHIMLELASKHNKKIFIISSSEVYGKNERNKLKENDDRILGSTETIRWNYSCSKALDEYLSFAYFQKHGLKVIVVRLFNTIGVGQVGSYGMVVPTLMKQAIKNSPITIYGDGSQSRCFCDVNNVVDALLLLDSCKNCFGQVYNIGSEEEITLTDLAKKIKEICKSKSDIKYIPYEKAYGKGYEDIKRRRPDLTKISALGYSPKISLDSSLRKIFDSLKNEA